MNHWLNVLAIYAVSVSLALLITLIAMSVIQLDNTIWSNL